MRLLRLATLIAVGASVAVEAATASTVNADIRSIKSHLNTLTKSLTSFTGQSSTATQILEDSDTLRSAINKAAKDSKALSALNIDDTVSIANAVTALQINIYSSLKLLISKEPQFKKASSKNVATVKQKLQLLPLNFAQRNSTDTFSDALIPKFSTVIRRVAPLLVGDIDFHFVQAIDAYTAANTTTS